MLFALNMASGRASYPSTLVSVSPSEESSRWAATRGRTTPALHPRHHHGLWYQLSLRHCPQASLHALRCEHGVWWLGSSKKFHNRVSSGLRPNAPRFGCWLDSVCSIARRGRLLGPRASCPSVEERCRLCIHVRGGTDSHHNGALEQRSRWRWRTSSATHRWPPLRRGRRHHGGSMSGSCLGAGPPMEEAPHAQVSAAHTDPRSETVLA